MEESSALIALNSFFPASVEKHNGKNIPRQESQQIE
jgi:hypothetical protein